MKTIDEMKQQRLIKEANKILDRVESNLYFIVTSIKQQKLKKAA